jgi:hypothetical protein
MEASAQPAAYERGGEAPAPGALGRLAGGFIEPVRSLLEEAGSMAAFAATAFAEMRGVFR